MINNKINIRNKRFAIVIFYVIAVVFRAIAIHINHTSTTVDIKYLAISWLGGIGPCLGAIAVVLLLKRRFYCSITGVSIIKSVLCVLIPFIICFFLYRELSYVLLGFIFYSFLEEVGWRGYLQGELMNKRTWLQVLIIGTMWFLWHININLSIGALIFWGILVFGAWGIGRIANDTHSLMTCACFHTLYNFSSHGFFKFSPIVIGIYVGVIASWFIIWYTPWNKVLKKVEGFCAYHGFFKDSSE